MAVKKASTAKAAAEKKEAVKPGEDFSAAQIIPNAVFPCRESLLKASAYIAVFRLSLRKRLKTEELS